MKVSNGGALMKNKLFIIIPLLLIIFTLTSCNVGSGSEPVDEQIDFLGGGGTATEVSPTGTTSDTYQDDSLDELTTLQLDDSNTDATVIDLSTLSTGDYEGYSLSKKGKLTISAAGVYQLSGNLTGYISVDAIEGDVRIILAGVSITVPDATASAAIVFKGSDTDAVGQRILTILDGTTNTLQDSAINTDENDGDEAVIQAKKTTSLTINGSGTLVLNAVGENTTGIKLKNTLYIIDTNLTVNANKNGIKANQTLVIMNANLNVTAVNDGIKTDMEASNADEATLYASDPKYGTLYIKNSNISVASGDDAIVANSLLLIDNSSNNTITLTTNNGAPNTVTEASSNNANGKALKVGGISLIVNDYETAYKSSYEDNYCLVIKGGTFNINSNDDAIHSNGNIIIDGGTFNIATGDDGIHADYLTQISGGSITITKSYEGIEGANIEILGGSIEVNASDDGVNAANGDFARGYNFTLYIGGGSLLIKAQGDGLDSNGSLTITGGTVIVFGPTGNDNGSLDADKGILVNGGNVLAVGSLGMVETPGTNSKQYSISLNLSSKQAANTTIKVYNSDKSVLLFEATPNKQFQSVIISLESFTKGSTYCVVIGSTEYSVTLTSVTTTVGTASNPWGGGGPGGPGRPGGR